MHEKKKSLSGGSEMYRVQIECIYDDLSDAQVQAQEKRLKEYNEFKKKFETYVSNKPELSIEKGDLCTFVEFITATSSNIQTPGHLPVIPVSTPQMQKQNGRVTTQATPPNNQILLVNNQRLGLTGLIVPTNVPIVSSASNITPAVSVVNVGGTNVTVTSVPPTSILANSTKSPSVVTRVSSPQLAVSNQSPTLSPNLSKVDKKFVVQRLTVGNKRPLDMPSTSPIPIMKPTISSIIDPADVSVVPSPAKKKYPVPLPTVNIDLTEDLSQIEGVSGTSGKTYPSLVVMAKPRMRGDKEAKSPAIVKEKQALDIQVRRVLLFTPQNFTEWLIQTGLLKCDHYCAIHKTDSGTKIKLKLGQYTDSNKFPFSGGYVWVSDCCPQTYISVFSGSVFEGASYPPTTTMKLIYHWACHSPIQNVMSWVKVSNFYIKNLFTNLRAVCTAAVHEHYEMMGGKGKKVQVGVVSLGSANKVRVDILALLDPETKIIRIRAVDPTPEPDRFVLRKFTKIFEIMLQWVDKDTIILVDNTVERSVLYNLGYKTVSQTMVKDKKGVDQYPNYEVMSYLRLIIPEMFQNTLSILSRQVIQQFLDELCWRERWGPFPARAFDTIIKHLIEQTKINSGGTLINRLTKISALPFKDWKYSKWMSNCSSRISVPGSKPPVVPQASGTCGGPPQKVTVTSSSQLIPPPSIIPPPPDGNSVEMESPSQVVLLPSRSPQGQGPLMLEAAKISLEPYYYGTLKGDVNLQNQLKPDEFSINCVICRKLYTSSLELTDHLIRHGVATTVTDTKDLCKLCCKVFPSQYFVQQHHVQVHAAAPAMPLSSVWCLMCNSRYKDINCLISHMSRFHGQLELPYHCRICKFRTSMFLKMYTHITTAHKFDDVAFCPYCFETIHYYHKGKPDYKNQYKFISHIQRHQLPLVKKCYKCLTTCINKTVLNEHELNDHKSFSSNETVERYSTDNDTFMPAPLEDPLAPKGEKIKPAVGGPYKVVNFQTPLIINDEDSKTVCIECDAQINNNHFVAELLCLTCDYSTCCIRGMNEHYYSSHSYSVQIGKIFKSIPVISDTNLNCSCSFTTKDGNVMANHLVVCKKTTCYGDPKIGGMTDIKSLIGQQSEPNRDEEEDEDLSDFNLTYTVGPSTSRRDINNATFTIHK